MGEERIWLDIHEQWMDDSTKAVNYALLTTFVDSCAKVDIYSLDGVKKATKHYYAYVSDPKQRIKNGLFTEYYSDGTDSVTMNYVNNILEGEKVVYYPEGQKRFVYFYHKGHTLKMLQYYPNGKLRREEFYEEGKPAQGRLYAGDGTELEFEPYNVRPRAADMLAFMQFVARRIRYPKDASYKKIQGRVLVEFDVDTEGGISNLKVVKSVYPSLDKEALAVLKSAFKNYKWISGKQDGVPKRMKHIVPVTFRLN
jgi:TonB family protein